MEPGVQQTTTNLLIKKKLVKGNQSFFKGLEQKKSNAEQHGGGEKVGNSFFSSLFDSSDESEVDEPERKFRIHTLGGKKQHKSPTTSQQNSYEKYPDLHKKIKEVSTIGFIKNKEKKGNHLEGSNWVQVQQKRNEFFIMNQQVANHISKEAIKQDQIIYIEASEAEKHLKQLKQQGKVFEDQHFPPTKSSLVGQERYPRSWLNIKWRRISEVMPNAEIFVGNVIPNDIKQGMLGDCYFLAGLAALAERKDRIFNLFLMHDKNEQKYYSVKMMYRGKWKTLDLDENIPYCNNQPAFSRSVDQELWVMLLQKAWAKLYGSYRYIQAGFPEEALHDLTGAPIHKIFLKQRNFNPEETWNYLLWASKKEYAMVASSNPGSDSQKSVSGVVQGHAYTFLNAIHLNNSDHFERIVQLRNPWGKVEFKGKWSDGDYAWANVSQSMKKEIGYEDNQEDGIFFMSFEDFVKEFRTLTIAEINDNASYVYESQHDPACEGVHFTIEVREAGAYSFHIDKTPERTYQRDHCNKFRYPQGTLQIRKVDGKRVQYLGGTISSQRTLYKSYDLKPGQYVVFAKIAASEFEKDREVTLAVYSQFFCKIKSASQEDVCLYKGRKVVKPENHSFQISGTELITEATIPLEQSKGPQKKPQTNVNERSLVIMPTISEECEKKEEETEYLPIHEESKKLENSDITEEVKEGEQLTEINESSKIEVKEEKKGREEVIKKPEEKGLQMKKKEQKKVTVKELQKEPIKEEKKKQSREEKKEVPKKKKKIVRKVEFHRVLTKVEHHFTTGESKIKTKTKEVNKETLEKQTKEGIQRDIKEHEHILDQLEDKYQGETLNKFEKFMEKVETIHESPDGETIRNIVTNEGITETCEEEGLESYLTGISSSPLSIEPETHKIKDVSESSECDTEEKRCTESDVHVQKTSKHTEISEEVNPQHH